MYRFVRQMLERDGYVVIPEFLFPEECDEMVEAGLDLAEKLPEQQDRAIFSSTNSQNHQLQDSYFLKSNDKIRAFFENGALDQSGNLIVEPKVSLNKVGHALHLLHPLFRCYTYCSRVKNVCKALGLSNPAVVQSMLIYKNPGIGGEVVPHQDATYLFTEPVPPVGFWIALQDANIQNGCLWIVPGSHKSGVHRRLIRNPDANSPDKLIYDKPPPVYPASSFRAMPVTKGSLVILHGLVVHKSGPNKSANGRPAYTFHIIETQKNSYSPSNWLQEGRGAPFQNLYNTLQLM